jgi:hypothetical protein
VEMVFWHKYTRTPVGAPGPGDILTNNQSSALKGTKTVTINLPLCFRRRRSTICTGISNAIQA